MEHHHVRAKTSKTKAQTVSTTGWPWGTKPTLGKVQLTPKLNPILYFEFAGPLVSKLLIFLHGFEVLKEANQEHKSQAI